MGFPGTWMTHSESVLYRVVPKCACSTIGQILYYSDFGHFHDGNIHDHSVPLHKWNVESSRGRLEDVAGNHKALAFTCVRNPFHRILSSFFDKICGIQHNGRRYRGNLVPLLIEKYGVEVGEDGAEFDQIASFRRFLLFARDTIRYRRPMEPDIHWSSATSHVATFVANGGIYDQIFHTEDFTPGMQRVLDAIDTPYKVDLSAVPKFNESAELGPRRAHPVEAYFDDLSIHMVQDIYRRDFDLYGYDADDPSQKKPVRPVDLERLHAKLAP